jgi:GNAT superfamily N-acetyltransferase
MPLVIRTALPADAEAISRIHRDSIRTLCRDHYAPEEIAAWSARPSPEKYLPAIESGDALVAVEGEKTLGFCLFDRDPAAIRVLYVAPEAVRRGVGTALLAKAELRLVRAGARELQVLSTLNAVPFYLAAGFTAGEVTRCSPMDDMTLASRRMTKRLPIPDEPAGKKDVSGELA